MKKLYNKFYTQFWKNTRALSKRLSRIHNLFTVYT